MMRDGLSGWIVDVKLWGGMHGQDGRSRHGVVSSGRKGDDSLQQLKLVKVGKMFGCVETRTSVVKCLDVRRRVVERVDIYTLAGSRRHTLDHD